VGPQGPAGAGAGSFSKSIHAITCTAQNDAPTGDANGCNGGGTIRTDGSFDFPCVVRASTTRNTYVCHVDLPSGALIDEVTAYGWDGSADGYFEAAIWRNLNTSFSSSYISPTFGGTWQNSGVPDAPGATSFPIYLNTDSPHRVESNYRYVIGFATKANISAETVWVHGFRIDYTVEP
jgi:hypothetical protein